MNIILRRRRLGNTSCREIASKSNEGIVVIRNDKFIPEELDVCVRWGCTSTINAKMVINKSAAIHQVNDKLGFRVTLEEADGHLAPKTWFSLDDWLEDSTEHPEIIIRPSRHAQGRNLLFVNRDNRAQMGRLDAFVLRWPNYYISKYIDKVSEFRIFVVSGRVVCVAQKTPSNPDEIAWNVAKGGRFDNVNWDNWNLKDVKTAIKAFNLTSLDFGGVDVMVDGNNTPYVIEINSAPSLTSPYRQSCMAKSIDYIIVNGRDRIPLIEELGNYSKFIHPAITNRALLL